MRRLLRREAGGYRGGDRIELKGAGLYVPCWTGSGEESVQGLLGRGYGFFGNSLPFLGLVLFHVFYDTCSVPLFSVL